MLVRHTALALAVSFLGLPFGSGHAATPRTLVAKVERVSDGDTVIAITSNQTKLRLRLLGIDAPEVPHGDTPGQPFGEEARDYLEHLIGGKTVRVDAYGPDEYKRVLAIVSDEQININLLMVAMGYAEVYRGAACQVYCRELEDAEAKARRDRVGMWAQEGKYESPRVFRQRQRIQGD
jgi:endonuclease YncB( thermonuclease family)